jgi:ribosomal protein S9
MAVLARYHHQRRVLRGSWKPRFTKQRINYRGTTKPTAPTLASISPSTGVAGNGTATITCTGTGFVSGVTRATVNGIDHATTFVSSTSVTFVMPLSGMSAGTVAVNVRNGSLFTATPRTYTVTAATALTLTSISPTTGVHGAANVTVTCTGTGFVTGVTKATINGTDVATTFVSATSVTFVFPLLGYTAATTVSINVRNGGLTGTAKTYTVT